MKLCVLQFRNMTTPRNLEIVSQGIQFIYTKRSVNDSQIYITEL
jgi:hypothetical protein